MLKQHIRWIPWLLAGGVFIVLRLTMVPGLYSLDSAEFMTAAYTGGFVHSPGYPLYTLLLHVTMHLHPGDPAFVGNLVSVWSLTLATPFLYSTLHHLTQHRGASVLATLLTIASYRIWLVGLFTEIYAPQLAALAITGYCVVRLMDAPTPDQSRWQWLTALSFGLAVTIHPALALTGGGILAVFLWLPLTWTRRIVAGILSVVVALLPYVYFPLRQLTTDRIPYNMLGNYDIEGVFHPVDFTQPENLLWLISGRQFESLFFSEGLLPSINQLAETGLLFFQNYAGVGLVLALYGMVYFYQQQRVHFWGWLAFFLPITYFYTTYGAPDKDLMFGATFLLLSVPLAFAFLDLLADVARRWQVAFGLLPLLFVVVNFPLLNQSHETAIRDRTDAFLEAAPDDAVIIGAWFDIAPLQYAHQVEDARPDVSLYNIFLFENQIAIRNFIRHELDAQRTVWLIDTNFSASFFDGFYMTRRIVGDVNADYDLFAVYTFEGYQP